MSIKCVDYALSKVYVCPNAEVIDGLVAGRRVILITDTNIHAHYRSFVERYEHIVIGCGEEVKTLATVSDIYAKLMAMGADRSTLLIGVGGGIVTDITGFVAATYMRGVKFGFISTTLLGQVDASVGGKNGVNIADYKNMVGTFTHPEFVILDIDMLRTLPKRELLAGMAEVVKAAIINDSKLFEELEMRDVDAMLDDRAFVAEMVKRALRVKIDIVENDEREAGLRRILNLGHTIGHAIEKCSRNYNHGEAVAVGIATIARFAVKRGALSVEECDRIERLLIRFGFDIDTTIPKSEIVAQIVQDKKRSGDIINLVLPLKIGVCKVVPMRCEEMQEQL